MPCRSRYAATRPGCNVNSAIPVSRSRRSPKTRMNCSVSLWRHRHSKAPARMGDVTSIALGCYVAPRGCVQHEAQGGQALSIGCRPSPDCVLHEAWKGQVLSIQIPQAARCISSCSVMLRCNARRSGCYANEPGAARTAASSGRSSRGAAVSQARSHSSLARATTMTALTTLDRSNQPKSRPASLNPLSARSWRCRYLATPANTSSEMSRMTVCSGS